VPLLGETASNRACAPDGVSPLASAFDGGLRLRSGMTPEQLIAAMLEFCG
jgi:hypothetical protein